MLANIIKMVDICKGFAEKSSKPKIRNYHPIHD